VTTHSAPGCSGRSKPRRSTPSASLPSSAAADRQAAAEYFRLWIAERLAEVAPHINGYVVIVDYIARADPSGGKVRVYDYHLAAEEAAVRIMRADESALALPQLVGRYKAMLEQQLQWVIAATGSRRGATAPMA